MIFSFWTGPAVIQPEFVDFWRTHVPGFRIFSDDDVLPIIKARFPDLYVPYCQIRLPACRSDVARLILLEEYGGLYIDAHTGCKSLGNLAAALSDVGNFDLGVFDRASQHSGPGDIHLVNGAIYARKNTPCIALLSKKIRTNLLLRYEVEVANRAENTFNLAVVTGAWNIRLLFFRYDDTNKRIVIREEFENLVTVIPLEVDANSCLQFYSYYKYRTPGSHWSERSRIETLFDIEHRGSDSAVVASSFPALSRAGG
jgi:hypothetical protein